MDVDLSVAYTLRRVWHGGPCGNQVIVGGAIIHFAYEFGGYDREEAETDRATPALRLKALFAYESVPERCSRPAITCLPNRPQCPTRSSGAVVNRPMTRSSHPVRVSFTHQLCKTETLICETR